MAVTIDGSGDIGGLGSPIGVGAGIGANDAVNLSQFASTLSGSGSQTLPSGLIIKWGSVTLTANPTAVTFPVAFPTGIFGVVATNTNNNATIACSSASASGFNISNYVPSTAAYQSGCSPFWIALGH